jgi:hypothetical protein
MESFEKSGKPDLNRRKFLGLLGAGVVASVHPAEAQERRRPELAISPEAEQVMQEWGIAFNGSEITAPSDFKEYNPVKWEKHKTAEDFIGVCLTSSAKRVEVRYVKKDDGTQVLDFGIKSTSGTNEGVSFHKYPPNAPRAPGEHFSSYYVLKKTAESYKEGRCSRTALVS